MFGQFNMAPNIMGGNNYMGNTNLGMNMNMGNNIGMNNNMNNNNNNFGMNNNNNNFGMNNNNFGMNKNNNFGMNNNNFGMINNNNNFAMMQNNIMFSNYSKNISLLEKLYNQYKFIKDPYEMQKKIALGLNNGAQYQNYFNKNALPFGFFTTSSTDNNSIPFNSEYINVIFVTMKGNSHIKLYKPNMKIKEMLEDFVIKNGLHTNTLNRIQFLYNATLLNNLPENMTLTQFNIVNNSKINVVDMFNVIGA